ncbi:methyltransferase regulatory domain-containing protein [Alphaproteobacteria bacterium]|nr:methyltransferase regulatory domain-containing protein [Alphaproteobacteria bacterium]
MTWTDGYISEVSYVNNYHVELSPSHIFLALVNAGFEPPNLENYNYLELGFGQGISLNVHAASNDGNFWGIDFNPEQTAHALEMSSFCGNEAVILDDSFDEFSTRPDIPDFDFIVLHGIWSWISEPNRNIILKILRSKLKPGGVVYLSYNTIPGWSPAIPLRHLLYKYSEYLGTLNQGIQERIEKSLEFAKRLAEIDNPYFAANPAVAERLEKLLGMSKSYLAHEFFNKDWDPTPFSSVAENLEAAKLSFATSANLLDAIDSINLSNESIDILKEFNDPIIKETIRDFCVNQQFRKDIFIRGGKKINRYELAEKLANINFTLIQDPSLIEFTLQGIRGSGDLKEEIYRPIIEHLNKDSSFTASTATLERALGGKADVFSIWQALFILKAKNAVSMTLPHDKIAVRKQCCQKLNDYLLYKSRSQKDIAVVSNPVTGTGIPLNHIEKIFLRASLDGITNSDELAKKCLEKLRERDETLKSMEKTVTNEAEAVEELTKEAKKFLQVVHPTLQRLSVCD